MTDTLTVVPEFDQADRMRKAQRQAGVSTAFMADQLGVRRETVSSWLNGHTKPIGPAVRMWAIITGVPLEWLETGSYTPSDSNPEPAVLSDFPFDQRFYALAS